jgi:hypothetical protein
LACDLEYSFFRLFSSFVIPAQAPFFFRHPREGGGPVLPLKGAGFPLPRE